MYTPLTTSLAPSAVHETSNGFPTWPKLGSGGDCSLSFVTVVLRLICFLSLQVGVLKKFERTCQEIYIHKMEAEIASTQITVAR